MQKQTSCFRKIKSTKFLYEINENGTIVRNVKSKKQLKIRLDKHHSKEGYYRVWIKDKPYMIHSLVAECWLGDRPDRMEIDHIDRNTHNNHYSNLRYVTHSEQMKNRKMSDRIIRIATSNCYKWCMENVAKRTKVVGHSQTKEFLSMTRAAKWIAAQTGYKAEHIRSKMKERRSRIYGYDIFYECRD